MDEHPTPPCLLVEAAEASRLRGAARRILPLAPGWWRVDDDTLGALILGEAVAFPPRTLTTPRLRLRPLELSDAQAAFEGYCSRPEATRYLAFRTQTTVAETEAFLERTVEAWETGVGHRAWAVVLRQTGVYLGSFGVDAGTSEVSFGYALCPEAWGRGFATEALQGVFAAALRDPTVTRFTAIHHPDNGASGRVMEKVGMRHAGTEVGVLVHPNLLDDPGDVDRWEWTRDDPLPRWLVPPV